MSANICVSGNFLFGLFFDDLLDISFLVVGILDALLSGASYSDFSLTFSDFFAQLALLA
jgi:hypothetical protein